MALVAYEVRLLGPVVSVTGWNELETSVVVAGAASVGAVVVASAAADAELTDPGYPSAAAALRAHLSGDDFVGVVVGTVALVAGEFATVVAANAV
ncbi:hypothetical protein [Halobaculum litoreum]|uniref:Uncharacterized protein n=1 Tax=Halobaculum litoreum TaxID=3031998 RepID=A0ABD5XTB7_9EURY|nr:hypothetical protein [Halobaculum sp. DT92]